LLCAFAGYSFAQKDMSVQNRGDWLVASNFLVRAIVEGTIEQKRDALLQIRNLEFAEASRIAVPALKDSSEIVRATAAASVIFLPPDEAAQNLLPLLSDKKPLVRREAAYALGAVGNPNSINRLLQLLQRDKVAEVRNAAIIALGQIGSVSVISELVRILQRKPQAKEEFARRSAARSVGQIAQYIQTGERQIVTPESFLSGRLETLKQPKYPRLVEAFPQFRIAINVLIQTLRNPQEFQDVKREAAFALGAIGDESATPVLQQNTNHADYYLAEISRESLRKIAVASEIQNSQ
jgi:HEAT repeat protein